MVDTMYAAPGIGLAAPQIGVPMRILSRTLLGRDPSGLIVMDQSEFVVREGMQLEEEGAACKRSGFQRNSGSPSCTSSRASTAPARSSNARAPTRAFQHEMDYLYGTLFVDRLRGIKRDLIVRRIKKLSRACKW